jgi:hypothetical protein
MSVVTASNLKALRERTTASLVECKEALAKAEGNVEVAIDMLRQKGLAAPLPQPSYAAQAFARAAGRPNPALPPALRFANYGQQQSWEAIVAEIGAGWFLDRFLFLFAEGLDQLQPCLDAWSFVVPPGHPDRMIVGRNAYGAILTLEDIHRSPGSSRIHMLDPLEVRYWRSDTLSLDGLVSNLASVPRFLDRDLYNRWITAGGHLDDDEILAVEVPLGLGGELADDNINIENIVKYYETTAPIYEKALAATRSR